jgi:hypothetical protein
VEMRTCAAEAAVDNQEEEDLLFVVKETRM